MSNILHSQERGDVLAHVSGNLRRFRLAAGLSQVALAEASGISRRMIVALEGGDANISLSSLDKLAAAMGVGFVDLVRDPARTPSAEINEVTWRGAGPESAAVLLGSAPAATEAQMWLWSLGPGERYEAEPDPAGWHEMIFVTDGACDEMDAPAPKKRIVFSGSICEARRDSSVGMRNLLSSIFT